MRSLSLLDKALLCKWSWWFASERPSLWRTVINRKFGEVEGVRAHVILGEGSTQAYGKKIRKDWNSFFQNVAISLRDGRRISF